MRRFAFLIIICSIAVARAQQWTFQNIGLREGLSNGFVLDMTFDRQGYLWVATEAGLNRLIKAGFKLLGLQTYLTAGEIESRAWTINIGTKAPQAAGKIHTDFEKGFIKAEIVSYDDLVKCGSKVAAREKGLVRLEGKDYVMQDGDVVEFRFNV